MKKYDKGLTLSKEELDIVGKYIKAAIHNITHQGTSPERFKILNNIQKRLSGDCK